VAGLAARQPPGAQGIAPNARGVLVLGGPTASGKTTLGIALAERYGAEIVSADSRQVYRDMPIGTAAPTADQQARVAHHLVGWVDPYERYSAARFVSDASAAIAGIRARGKNAIVVGGTGFYLRALCGDVGLGNEPDPVLRERVRREGRAHPLDVLHEWLRARDPQRAAAVSPADPYRILRALEIDLARAGKRGTPSGPSPLPTLRTGGIPFVKLVLRVDPPELEQRIAERTRTMLAGGLIEEAERIGGTAIAADAVGYRETLAYLSGWLTFAELGVLLTRATRRYAKRQLTWFRSEPSVVWIEAGDVDAIDAAAVSIGWRSAFSGDADEKKT
jgi:tRNA dimethylallyltransferase